MVIPHTRGLKKYKNSTCVPWDRTSRVVVEVGTIRLCPRLLLGHTVYQLRCIKPHDNLWILTLRELLTFLSPSRFGLFVLTVYGTGL